MATKEEVDTVLMIAVVFLGFILFILAVFTFKGLNKACPVAIIKSGVTALMAMGAIMTTVGIGYFICTSNNTCYFNEGTTSVTEIYFGVATLLSILMVVLSSLMLSNFDKNSRECGDKDVRGKLVGFVAVSVVLFIACIAGSTITSIVPRWYGQKPAQKKVTQRPERRGPQRIERPDPMIPVISEEKTPDNNKFLDFFGLGVDSP